MSKEEEYKKIFYEEMYKGGRVHEQGKGLNPVDILYDKLKRFELHREDAVARVVPVGERLLDIGCGSGSFIFKIRDKFKEMHGVDIASGRIQEADRLKERLHRKANITFHAVDIDRGLPYRDGYFNVITCIATFEHIYDPYFVIGEIKRILKKGGILILEVPNIAWLPRRMSFLLGRLPATSNEAGWDGGHLHYFTVGSLNGFLTSHGFTIISVSGAGIFSSIRNCWVSLLSGDIIIKAQRRE